MEVREEHRSLCGLGSHHSLLRKRAHSLSQNWNVTGLHWNDYFYSLEDPVQNKKKETRKATEQWQNVLYIHLTEDSNANSAQYNPNQFSVDKEQERYMKEDVQAAPKHVRWCCTLPVIKEMQIKLNSLLLYPLEQLTSERQGGWVVVRCGAVVMSNYVVVGKQVINVLKIKHILNIWINNSSENWPGSSKSICPGKDL